MSGVPTTPLFHPAVAVGAGSPSNTTVRIEVITRTATHSSVNVSTTPVMRDADQVARSVEQGALRCVALGGHMEAVYVPVGTIMYGTWPPGSENVYRIMVNSSGNIDGDQLNNRIRPGQLF